MCDLGSSHSVSYVLFSFTLLQTSNLVYTIKGQILTLFDCFCVGKLVRPSLLSLVVVLIVCMYVVVLVVVYYD